MRGWIAILWLLVLCDAFVPSKQQRKRPFAIQKAVGPVPLRTASQLYFFGRNKEPEQAEKESVEGNKSSFFNFLYRDKTEKAKESEAMLPLTPTEEAIRLRDEAARARLEAERMDAELVLSKIERLEKELAAASTNDNKKHAKSSEDLRREIDFLLNKVQCEKQASSSASSSSSNSTSNTDSTRATHSTSDMESSTTAATPASKKAEALLWPKYVEPFDEEKCNEIYRVAKFMPQFVQASLSLLFGLELKKDPETGKPFVNTTELAFCMDQVRRFDFSYSSKPPPTFTPQQIAETEAKLKEAATTDTEKGSLFGFEMRKGRLAGGDKLFNAEDDDTFIARIAEIFQKDKRFAELWANDTKTLAELALEYDYYTNKIRQVDPESEDSVNRMMKIASEDPWLKPLQVFGSIGVINGTGALDDIIAVLYPQCTTKKGAEDGSAQIPTEAQVWQLITDILPKVNFQATSKPEPVLGGFIVRGSTTADGDAFVTKLDAAMERSNLKDKMTVLYADDFSILKDDSFDETGLTLDDVTPILYIVAPNICRDAKPFQLSIVSACGLATTWYLSVYPFLLNPAIAARVDEQLAIANANMVADLAWLADLSVPLFATFMGIQVIHELGHLVVAGANGIKTSTPTLVPSLLTGITSSVTTFRSPPKNRAAMFDFAVAGPLFGMVASMLAIVAGSQLTAITDPSLFPALPMEILRQSVLGGGIIELVLGNGALYVPEAALGTSFVTGMTVPLHPIAIAGFISLIVNAMALLPVGTTDGGRASLALFGRGVKGLIGIVVLALVLVRGVLGSDLFLIYFAFCTAFQRGNEIPARNEVGKLDLPRTLAAVALNLLVVLALSPFPDSK